MLEPFKIVWTGEQYRVSIPNYEGGMVYKEADLLPVLREARWLAQRLTCLSDETGIRAADFLDATKGVEG